MKTLTLLRHAKSGDDAGAGQDFERALNGKGRRAARTVGRHLRARGVSFDRVIASPARRVAETIEELATGRAAAIDPQWERELYLASARELLDVVRRVPDEVGHLLLVGHNPGLEELVLCLVPAPDPDAPDPDAAPAAPGPPARGAVAEKYPTCSLAEIELMVDRWADAAAGRGRLARFTRPRDLDPALGPDRG